MISAKEFINLLIERPRFFLDTCMKRIEFLFPDKMYLSIRYYLRLGRVMHWNNPVLYQEKLQWLKLNNKKEIFTRMVDKVAVKDIVAEKIGPQYVIPTLGVWGSFDEIDFDQLPDKFVLKSNRGGGNSSVIVCKDKSKLDKADARKKLEMGLTDRMYRKTREWPYKNIVPKILAEQLLEDDSEMNADGMADYKFTCFNGTADNVMVCVDRQSGNTKYYFFDKNWNVLPYDISGKELPATFKLPKPACIDEMFEIAGKLSEGIPFLRVDLYCVNDRPYFGETTFYPASGLDEVLLPETEVLFGSKIDLSIVK